VKLSVSFAVSRSVVPLYTALRAAATVGSNSGLVHTVEAALSENYHRFNYKFPSSPTPRSTPRSEADNTKSLVSSEARTSPSAYESKVASPFPADATVFPLKKKKKSAAFSFDIELHVDSPVSSTPSKGNLIDSGSHKTFEDHSGARVLSDEHIVGNHIEDGTYTSIASNNDVMNNLMSTVTTDGVSEVNSPVEDISVVAALVADTLSINTTTDTLSSPVDANLNLSCKSPLRSNLYDKQDLLEASPGSNFSVATSPPPSEVTFSTPVSKIRDRLKKRRDDIQAIRKSPAVSPVLTRPDSHEPTVDNSSQLRSPVPQWPSSGAVEVSSVGADGYKNSVGERHAK
jgi:hypothetical protein